MQMHMPEPLLDPRARQKRPRLTLAPRVSIEDLRRGKVLFYDNTKLEAGNYTRIFPRLKEQFRARGVGNFIDVVQTPRGKGTDDLNHFAAELASHKPVAAVVALADIGVTPATTVITVALERLGIPAVLITAGPGVKLAQAVAFYRAGRLCLCPFDIYQGSTVEEILAESDSHVDYIIECLTLGPSEIERRAMIEFELDKAPPGDLLPFSETPSSMPASREGSTLDPSRAVEPGCCMEEIMEQFCSGYLSDGLPVIPPTLRRFGQMMAYCPYGPNHVLAHEIGPSGSDITVREVVIAAVMAGCKPEYVPVLLTAFKALADPKYNLLQAVTTSHPGGDLILVSGPIAQELGIHGGQGCLGPGFRANATIGRAVNLAITNACRSVPGVADLGCLASQAEYSYCFAEDPGLTPWKTMNEERFDRDTTCVLVMKAEPPHDIIDFLSSTGGDLLDTLVDSCTTLGTNNSYMPGNLILVLTPDHARLLNRNGYTKDRIREHVHQQAHHPAPMVRNRGLVPVRPPGFDQMHPIPVTRSAQDVEIVVAGGRGGHSAVILPWGLHSEAVVEPVSLPEGRPARSVMEFRR